MSEFWCITTYFNPCGYQSRARNYRIFADRLADQGVNLLTIELAFGNQPFELAESNQVVQLRSNSVLWQKERLINYAMTRLPTQCDRFAWLDCDLLFRDNGWAIRLANLLEHYDVLQLFGRVLQLAPGEVQASGAVIGWSPGIAKQALEVPDWLVLRTAGKIPFGLPGFGWAVRRPVLEHTGLYDRLILGSGDAYFADCLFDSFGLHPYWEASTDEMALDLDFWRRRLTLLGALRIGYLPGDVYHLWHGRFADRRYEERNMILVRHGFDPMKDLVREGGVYEWASKKPSLHAEVKEYFIARSEDRQTE